MYFGHQNPGYFLSEDGPINGLDPSYSYSHSIFVLSIKVNTSRCFNQHMNLGPGLIQTFPFTQFHCEYIEWGQIAFSNDIHIDKNSCVTLLPWNLLVKKCCLNNYISVVELTFDLCRFWDRVLVVWKYCLLKTKLPLLRWYLCRWGTPCVTP